MKTEMRDIRLFSLQSELVHFFFKLTDKGTLIDIGLLGRGWGGTKIFQILKFLIF